MVKKLFKHEFLSYVRTLLPIYILLLFIAASGRFIQIFENDSTVYSIVSGSSIFVYVVSLIVALVLTFIFAVRRFYTNLFTGEGYLTFTLPVTTANHITVKAVTAVVFQFFTIIAMLLSACIITAGDVFAEIIKAAAYLLKLLYGALGGHIWFYALEILLALIAVGFCEYLLFYTCISIGQLSRKNRVIAAVGVYFAYYVITQIIGTVITVIFVVFEEHLPIEPIMEFVGKHPFATGHIVICGLFVIYAVMATVYYVITNTILRKRLNLE